MTLSPTSLYLYRSWRYGLPLCKTFRQAHRKLPNLKRISPCGTFHKPAWLESLTMSSIFWYVLSTSRTISLRKLKLGLHWYSLPMLVGLVETLSESLILPSVHRWIVRQSVRVFVLNQFIKLATVPAEYGLYSFFVGLLVYCISPSFFLGYFLFFQAFKFFATPNHVLSIGPVAIMSVTVTQIIQGIDSNHEGEWWMGSSGCDSFGFFFFLTMLWLACGIHTFSCYQWFHDWLGT